MTNAQIKAFQKALNALYKEHNIGLGLWWYDYEGACIVPVVLEDSEADDINANYLDMLRTEKREEKESVRWHALREKQNACKHNWNEQWMSNTSRGDFTRRICSRCALIQDP